MSEYETKSLARLYCPGCEPDADPSREILETRWCGDHIPRENGVDDASVVASAWLSGSTEAGGDDNRRWCELLSRKKRLLMLWALAVLMAGCALKPPVYICVPARMDTGELVIACVPQGGSK